MDQPVSLEARRIELAFEAPFHLGSARVDPPAHEIRWAAEFRRIQPQMLKVLVALHDRMGDVVTRDQLVDRCWDGRFVGEDAINRSISILRRIFAESGGVEIQTVPRGGYRLVEGAATGKAKAGPRLWVIGGAAVVLIAGFGITALGERGQRTDSEKIIEVEALNAPPDDRPARALSEGMRSSIEGYLTGSGSPISLGEGARKGEASLALRGSSITDHGELRASVELLSPRTGAVVWASNFKRLAARLDDLREQLSLQVARVLHCAYADGRAPYFDADPEFAKLSLAHCDLLGRESADEAVRLDAQIVQRAPAFARGWSEYAIDSAFAARDLPPSLFAAASRRVLAFARRALALDPHQGLAYTAIGVTAERTGSWAQNERLARQALVADPKSPEAHNWQSGQFAEIGRIQDSLNEARISYQLDHFLPGKLDQLLQANIATGNLDDARGELVLAQRYWPGNPWFDSDAILLGLAGSAPDYAAKLLTSHVVQASDARERALVAFLRWRIAPMRITRQAAINALENASRVDGPTIEQIQLLGVLGDLNAAYQIAARLPNSSVGGIGWWIPGLDAFRTDPRFMALAARRGLADIWLQTGLWPDFCTTPDKLNSCKAAAAKAVAEWRQSAAATRNTQAAL